MRKQSSTKSQSPRQQPVHRTSKEIGEQSGMMQPKPRLDFNTGPWMNRIVVGHPCTGLIRVEWMMARMGQTIPCNWSQMDIMQFMSPYVPLCYQVADAENLIARAVMESGSEWLLLHEHDNIAPNDSLVMLNEYMIDGKVPVVGGLYFTKSVPPEPLIYRGTGQGYYADWKMGDKVWCSGLPFGFTLIHSSIIKVLWNESPEYVVNGQTTRRVFQTPRDNWMDPEKGTYVGQSGTSDLAWCKRLQTDDIFKKAGWPEYQDMEFPFLVDTNLFCWHIDNNGVKYPIGGPPAKFLKPKPPLTHRVG